MFHIEIELKLHTLDQLVTLHGLWTPVKAETIHQIDGSDNAHAERPTLHRDTLG